MEYREKLVWAQLVPFGLTLGCYLVFLGFGRQSWPNRESPEVYLPKLLFGLTLVQLACMGVVGLLSRREPRDERVRLMEFKAVKTAYSTMLWVTVGWLSYALSGRAPEGVALPAITVLAGLLGAEVVRACTLLVLFRRDAQA